MIRLLNSLAYVYFSCGQEEKCEAVIGEVLKQSRELDDKLPAYKILIWLKLQHGSSTEALDLTFSVVRMISGRRFSRRFLKLQIGSKAFKVFSKLRSMSDEEILSLPDLHDPKLIQLVDFITILLLVGAASELPLLFALGALEVTELALNHGICIGFEIALAAMAALFADFKQIDRAYQLGELALKIGQRNGEPCFAAKATLVATGFSLHWKTPLHSCLPSCYESAMTLQREGDVNSLMIGFLVYIYCYYYCGLPLWPMYLDMMKMMQVLMDYGQVLGVSLLQIRGQLVQNLMGKGYGNPTDLKGDLLDPDTQMIKWKEQKQEKGILLFYVSRQYLAYYFEDLELAEKMTYKLPRYWRGGGGPGLFLSTRLLFDGLIFLGRYKVSLKRRYLRKADLTLKECKNLVGLGCVNLPNVTALLEAERATAVEPKNTRKIQQLFDRAISLSGRTGFLSVQAMANELAFKYFQGRDPEWSKTYLYLSLELYSRWGAAGKVKQLMDKYGHHLGDKRQEAQSFLVPSRTEGGLRGRQRFESLRSSSLTMPDVLQ